MACSSFDSEGAAPARAGGGSPTHVDVEEGVPPLVDRMRREIADWKAQELAQAAQAQPGRSLVDRMRCETEDRKAQELAQAQQAEKIRDLQKALQDAEDA